jgi:putative membrane protein
MTRFTSIAMVLAVCGAGAHGVAILRAQTTPPPAQRPATSSDATRPETRAFINEMTIAGLAEVQLGKIASQRASAPDVKTFGQMMVKDHSQGNRELAKIAADLKVQPPTELDEKHKDLADKLSRLQGAEFDREYMNAMVEGHQHVATELRAHGSSNTMPNEPAASGKQPPAKQGPIGTSGGRSGEQALDQWTSKTLAAVQKHLERAKELQSKIK